MFINLVRNFTITKSGANCRLILAFDCNLKTRSCYSTDKTPSPTTTIKLFDQEYARDDWTNVNKSISDKLNRNLLHQRHHPLNHLANKIKYFFYKHYPSRSGSPLFSIYDNFKPIVSVEQNFDRFV